MKVWGLTGGIASGKSTVAKVLGENGFVVVDADAIAREVRAESSTAKLLEKEFGTFDPKKIREKVFLDEVARTKLESLLHPLIHQKSQKRFEEIRKNQPDAKGIIYEASLLFKAGRQNDFDGVILVKAPQQKRIAYLMNRDQLSQEAAKTALNAEDPTPNKEGLCAFIVENDGTPDDLKSRAKDLAAKLK